MKKNLSWQTVYQLIAICTPLITTPYLSRVLGADGIGIFAYTYSTVLLFRMIALLGNENYGTREIAKIRDNPRRRTIIFRDIFFVQFVATALSAVLFLMYLLLTKDNRTILLVQGIWIFDCFINISWFYSGLERFKYRSIVGIVFKTVQTLLIFLLVKNENHVGRYALILSSCVVATSIVLWFGTIKCIQFRVLFSLPDFRKTLYGTLVLFIPVATGSIFHLMDKIMLGKMSTSFESGIYYNSDHIVNIPNTLVYSLCMVVLSRLSFCSKDKTTYQKIFRNYSELILAIAVAMSLGIDSIAQIFIPFFLGNEFEPCINIIYYFSLIMIIKSFSYVITLMYLIPNNKDKIYVRAVICGAVLNIIFNYIFIGLFKMGALGATFGTMIAEFAILFVELLLIRKEVRITPFFARCIPYVLFGIIMLFVVRCFINYLHYQNTAVLLIVSVFIGVICYAFFTLLYILLTKKHRIFLTEYKNE